MMLNAARKSGRTKKPSAKVMQAQEKSPENKAAMKLLEAAGAGAPNRNVGRCSAMGDECGNPQLERLRHFCVDCGDGVHAIEPCGFETEDGIACANCILGRKEKEAAADNEEKKRKRKESELRAVAFEKYGYRGAASDLALTELDVESDGDVGPNIRLSTGRCPARGPFCNNPKAQWGDVRCRECLEPVHKTATCLHVGADGNKWCLNCWNDHLELEDAGVGIVRNPNEPPLRQPSQLSQQEFLSDNRGDSFDNESVTSAVNNGEEVRAGAQPAAKKTRGPNFTDPEDYLITEGWASVSADSRNGTGQKLAVFEEKFKNAVHELVVAWNEKEVDHPSQMIPLRSAGSIMYRWTNHIRPKSMKWAGICKLVKRKSGEDDEILLGRRQKFYMAGPGKGKKFPFVNAYAILETLPKWTELDENKDKAGRKKKRMTKAEKKAAKKAEKEAKAARTIGKRQKALNEKVKKIVTEVHGAPTIPLSIGAGGDAMSMVNNQLSAVANQFMVAEWRQGDREQYYSNQATLQMLQQEKEIKLLRRQLADIDNAPPLPSANDRADGSDEDSSSDDDSTG